MERGARPAGCSGKTSNRSFDPCRPCSILDGDRFPWRTQPPPRPGLAGGSVKHAGGEASVLVDRGSVCKSLAGERG